MMLIAECGVNWRTLSDLFIMFMKAKEAGADAVKVQLFNEEIIEQMPPNPMLRARLKTLILNRMDVKYLESMADTIGIKLIATPMYPEAVSGAAWLSDYIKIRYADRYNDAILTQAVLTGRHLLISCDLEYLGPHLPGLIEDYKEKTFMYCQPGYPPDKLVIPTNLGTVFKGYSNHFRSVDPPLLAHVMGCEYIEVHVYNEDAVGMAPPEYDAIGNLFNRPTDVIDYKVSLSFAQLAELKKRMEHLRPWVSLKGV